MIPHKLELKNFLSYGPEIQTVDFATYPLICLSGKNGHGKSALLDAITWAIWGTARKVADASKADEGLLRLGQTHMLVMLDFEFNGALYRVRREFAKAGSKTHANLDFGLINTSTNSLIPLTEKTIRATQAKIDGLLNLDAESFINSAFLRQGQSNEFSKKSSKDRKEILASILGIARYESIRKSALEKAKQATAEKTALTTLTASIERDLQTKAEIITHLEQVTAQCAALTHQEQNLAHAAQTLEKEKGTIADQQQQLKMVQFQRDANKQEEIKHLEQLRSVRSAWQTAHRNHLALGDQTELEARKATLVTAIAEHQQALQKSLDVKEQMLSTKEKAQALAKTITDAHYAKTTAQQLVIERLEFESASMDKQLATLTTEQAALAVEKQQLQNEIASLQKTKLSSELAQEVAACEQQFERRKDYYQQWMALGTWTKNELASLGQKNNLVHDDDNPSCPLCEQNLTASRKRFLKTAFAKQEQFLTHRINRLAQVVKKLKVLLTQQHEHLTALKKRIEDQQHAAIKIAELSKHREKLEIVIAQNVAAHEQLTKELDVKKAAVVTQAKLLKLWQDEQQTILNNNADYQSAARSIAEMEKLITSCYKLNEHQAAITQLKIVDEQLAAYAAVREQAALQTQRTQTIRDLCATIKKLRAQQQQLASELLRFAQLPHLIAAALQKEKESQAQAAELKTRKEALLQEKGKLESQQAALTNLEKEHKKHQESIAQLNATIDDYQAIAVAMGKDGIQALLIEDAIPEIEHEANQLLAKLTNNQAHLIIESLRDLKKGGTKETLDIKISDSVGIRPYELFSGGEAFRIDFALRIAISKLLARRAGTSLQTLIIDEGFGSQDEEGLSHIMDAIYKIQDDFAKVIIVSHLPAMKDQFPVHFVVEKGPNGSVVKVIEQD